MPASAAGGGLQVVLCGDFLQLPPIPQPLEPLRFAFEAECWGAIVEVCWVSHRMAERGFGNDVLKCVGLGLNGFLPL